MPIFTLFIELFDFTIKPPFDIFKSPFTFRFLCIPTPPFTTIAPVFISVLSSSDKTVNLSDIFKFPDKLKFD